MKPLVCATAGSVDDGKSTLLGRLMLDAKVLLSDQIEHLERASQRRGLTATDLSLATDGLRAEREQGITIDVAWRYFATPKRRFILADSPGHVQYTRNMVTAASHADVGVIVVDGRRGMTEQTRRHLLVARLLGVPAIVVAVNKMDLLGFDLAAFARVRDDITAFLRGLDLPRDEPELAFVPVSALHGDNVVHASHRAPWYDGPSLLSWLESSTASREEARVRGRLPVQMVLRDPSAEGRGYAGRVAAGELAVGQRVRVAASGTSSTIARIATLRGPTDVAVAGQSVLVHLADELDVGRGDLLVADGDDAPAPRTRLVADVAWMHTTPAAVGTPYILKHGATEVRAFVEAIETRYDVTTGRPADAGAEPIRLNELCRLAVRTTAPIATDAYRDARATGSFLLIDPVTASTLAAGMIR